MHPTAPEEKGNAVVRTADSSETCSLMEEPNASATTISIMEPSSSTLPLHDGNATIPPNQQSTVEMDKPTFYQSLKLILGAAFDTESVDLSTLQLTDAEWDRVFAQLPMYTSAAAPCLSKTPVSMETQNGTLQDVAYISPDIAEVLIDLLCELSASVTCEADRGLCLHLLRRILVNLWSDPEDARYRSITLRYAQYPYLHDVWTLFIMVLENVGFSITSSETSNQPNSPEAECSPDKNDSILHLSVTREADADFRKLLDFAKALIETLTVDTPVPSRKQGIRYANKEGESAHSSVRREVAANTHSFRSSKRDLTASKRDALQKQLIEVRHQAKSQFDQRATLSEAPKSFALLGMTPAETKAYLREEASQFVRDSSPSNQKAAKFMDLKALDKPCYDWKPEMCAFIYAEAFKNEKGFAVQHSLAEYRLLMYNFEYIGRMALDYTNHYRSLRYMPPLTWNEDLMRLGEIHSKNMAEGRVPVGHDGAKERFSRFPFGAKRCGENVSYTGGEFEVAKVSVDGWIHSPGHEKNLRGPYTFCGIGVYGISGHFYLTQLLGGH